MGNCLIRNNQISARDDDDDDNYYHEQQPRESEVDQPKKKTTTSDFSLFESEEPAAAMPEESMKKKKKKIKKKVRFELQKDDEERVREETRRRSGSVRIKLIVTQEELKRILTSNENDTQHTTLEQLLSSVKLGGSRRICQVIGEDGSGAINAWRPTLESIPEDQ